MARRVTKLELSELSLVDNPANQHARVVLHKRNAVVGLRMSGLVELLKGLDDQRARSFAEVLSQSEKWRRQSEVQQELWPVYDALMTSINSTMGDSSLEMSQRVALVNENIDQFMVVLREKVPEVEEEISKALEAAVARSDDPEVTDRGDRHMPGDDTKKVSDLEKSVADLTTQIVTLQKQATDLAAERDAAKARVSELEKAEEIAKSDEVVKIGDVEMRKSVVGDATFAVIKAQAAQNEEITKRLELANLEKQVEADWPSLPGTPSEKALVAKAVAGIPEEVRKSLQTMLSAGNGAQAALSRAEGRRGEIAKGSPEDELQTLAKKHLADNPDVGSIEKAYAAVLDGPEGKRLYEASLSAPRSVN